MPEQSAPLFTLPYIPQSHQHLIQLGMERVGGYSDHVADRPGCVQDDRDSDGAGGFDRCGTEVDDEPYRHERKHYVQSGLPQAGEASKNHFPKIDTLSHPAIVAASSLIGKPKTPPTVICPYCAGDAELVEDSHVYAKSYGGYVWLCRPCRAWVGTHRHSPLHKPLGRLAKADLRAKKIKAHCLFDRLWKAAVELRGWSNTRARRAAYAWLAGEMQMPVEKCHIGHFDEGQTQVVITLCEAAAAKKEAM